MEKDIEMLRKLIKAALKVCSYKNYLGYDNIKDANKKKPTTLGFSASSYIDKRLKEKKEEINNIFKQIEKTTHKNSYQKA